MASLLLGSAVIGWGLGAPATVAPGTVEQGQGADVGEQTPAYWVWQAAQVWGMPSPVPAMLSTVSLTPTLLPAAGASFRINGATAANTSVRWEFGETTAAPGSTELELRFTDGLSRAASTLTVYLETRPGTLPAGLTFFLYWDAGAFGPSGVTVETMHVIVLACAGIGRCP
ncbi:MAG: hypothetical protein L3K02_02295 [Thermoplasmata archaeon]|nr:hypothetical protein [Thermoplasmata archaeon]